jgi:hypothetical protein
MSVANLFNTLPLLGSVDEGFYLLEKLKSEFTKNT